MKFRVNIGVLGEAITQASITTDRLRAMAIGHVYIKAVKHVDQKGDYLYVYSTNIDAETVIKIPAKVEVEGDALIDPSQVNGGIAGRPKEDEITIEKVDSGNMLSFKYGRSKFHVHCGVDKHNTLSTYLTRVPFTEKATYKVKGADLAEFCRRGLFCIPADDNGQAGMRLGGMYFSDSKDGYSANVTDGAICAEITVKAEKASLGKFMVPLKSLTAINRLLGKRREDQIDITEYGKDEKGQPSKVYFRTGDVIFGTKLLIGSLENVKNIVQATKPKYIFEISRAELKNALDRTSNFADSQSRVVRLEIKKESMSMHMKSMEGDNNDVIEVEHRSEFIDPVKMGINIDYLLNISGGSTAPKLEIGITGPTDAVVVSDNSDERVKSTYVLMPVRL